MSEQPEILFNIQGAAGIITLNSPQALNALSYGMVQQMDKMLIEWASNPAVKAVIVTGAGDRAFCSGGDIKSVAIQAKAGGGELTRDFFRLEYTMNHRIFTYPKPYISLIKGIVMGGGKGVSAHGSHRIVTENTLFAMPETGIGFFPDVGGGYFLPRCPGQTGAYLALTSKRIKAADTLHIGFATHYVTLDKMEALQQEISQAPEKLDELLKAFSSTPAETPEIAQYRDQIDRCFAHDHVEEIIRDLEKDGSPWAMETLSAMNGMSPSSLKVALKQIRMGAAMSFAEVMAMEYRISQALLTRPDFYEGVRAALIDKDRQPKWSPATVAAVPDSDVAACFQSLGSQDLVLPDKFVYNP